jgi:transposase
LESEGVRVVALIASMFHLRVSVTAAWRAMRRLGYTRQLPIHGAIERDEQAVAAWRRPSLGRRAG